MSSEWDETPDETAEEGDNLNLSRIRELLDGEALDLDEEYKKRRCSNCFYAILKRSENNGDDVHELKCFYSQGNVAEIAPHFFCGFWLMAGPKTLEKRSEFQITSPAWTQYFDHREEF